ncbi:unnamed protein product [Camellia sinensis]
MDVKDIGDKWNQLPEEEKNKVKIQTQIKLTSICKIIRRLDKAQQQAVTDMGFHGILSLRYTHMDHDLCHWLVQNFDPSTHSLNVHGLRMLLTVEDVHELMGLPSNGLSVKLTESVDEITNLCDELAVKNKFVPFTSLKSYLIETKDVRTEFKKKFVLYIIGALLCPTTKADVHQSFIQMVKNVESISQFNWAKHTLDFLVDRIAIAKVKERSTVCGCLLLLIYFTWNNLLAKNELVATSNPITRLSYWGNSKIKQGLNQIKALGGYLNVEVVLPNIVEKSNAVTLSQEELTTMMTPDWLKLRNKLLKFMPFWSKATRRQGKMRMRNVAANSPKFLDEDEIRNMNDKEPMETSLNAVTMSSSCSVVHGPHTRGTQNCKASQWLCTLFVKFDVTKRRPQLKPSSNNNNYPLNDYDSLVLRYAFDESLPEGTICNSQGIVVVETISMDIFMFINLIVVKLTNKQRKKFPNKDHMVWYFPTHVSQKILCQPSDDTMKDIVEDYFGIYRYTSPLHAYKELLQYAHREDYVQDISSFAFQWLEDMPRQDNSYNCGLFVIKYMQGKPLPLDVIKAELRARGELKRK